MFILIILNCTFPFYFFGRLTNKTFFLWCDWTSLFLLYLSFWDFLCHFILSHIKGEQMIEHVVSVVRCVRQASSTMSNCVWKDWHCCSNYTLCLCIAASIHVFIHYAKSELFQRLCYLFRQMPTAYPDWTLEVNSSAYETMRSDEPTLKHMEQLASILTRCLWSFK